MLESAREFGATGWDAAKKNYVIVLLGVLLIFLVKIFQSQSEHSILLELIRDIGISLIVAFVIIIGIEHRSRLEQKELIQQFLMSAGENLHSAILGVEFPPKMYEFAKNQLMKAPFYRTDSNITYTIRFPTDREATQYGARLVILHINYSYTVINTTKEGKNFPLIFGLEENLTSYPKSVLDELGKCEVYVNNSRLSDTELAEANRREDDKPGITKYLHNVTLNPSGRHGSTVRIEIKYSTVKLIADTEIFRSIYSCDGAKITISYPDEIEVYLDGIHPSSLANVTKSVSLIQGSINDPLFPSNGFLIWWYPKNVGSGAGAD